MHLILMGNFFARKGYFLATLTLFTASFGAIANAQEAVSPANPLSTHDHAAAQKIILPGVANFGEVNQKLYRGGQPTNHGLANLHKMGVELVVDLREGARSDERDAVTKLGMQYVSIPWRCGHPDHETTARFLTVLRENQDKRIFVHCYYGSDRTGMMVAAFRMTQENWSAAEAGNEMRAYGFSLTHRMMCPGLASYEESFPGAFKTSPAFEKLRPAETAPQP